MKRKIPFHQVVLDSRDSNTLLDPNKAANLKFLNLPKLEYLLSHLTQKIHIFTLAHNWCSACLYAKSNKERGNQVDLVIHQATTCK